MLDADGGRLDDGGSEMSVQALDLEVLVVSSREADFRVAMVFDGDLSIGTAGSGNPSPNPNPNPNPNPSPDRTRTRTRTRTQTRTRTRTRIVVT